MAHQRREDEKPAAGLNLLDDEVALDTGTPVPVELADDLAAVVRRAAEQRRLVVPNAGRAIAAIIPIEDLQLLLRLEEEELDRIDREDARRAIAAPDNYPTVLWDGERRDQAR